jgi:hypothetical protein
MRKAALLVLLLAPLVAKADFHIRNPNEIDQGELELEHNGSTTFDRDRDKAGQNSYTAEIGAGMNSWWHPELELDIERDDQNAPTKVSGFTWENTFLLTEPGEGWVDLGFYAEYSHSSIRGVADDILFGPLLQKDIGRTTHTLNLFLTKQLGGGQDDHNLDFSYAWQSRWNIYRPLSPAIEAYGDAGDINRPNKYQQQQLIAGPALVGMVWLGNVGKLKYEAGYLFGMTDASPSGTFRWKAEIEMPI